MRQLDAVSSRMLAELGHQTPVVDGIDEQAIADIGEDASATNQFAGRLVVRRIPDLNQVPGQDALFDTWRFHAFFTTTDPDTADTLYTAAFGPPTPAPT